MRWLGKKEGGGGGLRGADTPMHIMSRSFIKKQKVWVGQEGVAILRYCRILMDQ